MSGQIENQAFDPGLMVDLWGSDDRAEPAHRNVGESTP